MRKWAFLGVSASMAVGLVWCSNGDAVDSGAPDGAPPDVHVDTSPAKDGTTDAPADVSPPCNSQVQQGGLINEVRLAQSPPVAVGNFIVPNGLYAVTSARSYTGGGGKTGPSGNTFKATVSLKDGQYELVTGSIDTHQNGTYALDASSISITIDCPTDAGTNPYAFYDWDPDASEIILYTRPDGSTAQSVTFTKK